MQASTLQELNKMIQDFNSLHLINARTEQTFMQLTDYPHLENVCSNVLAFFFNTQAIHNFGNLFVKALLECINADTNCRSTEAVEREMSTDKGNRIDIFIETEKYLIAIENKLYSGVNNPLRDYEAHIKKLCSTNEKEPIFILLTLKDERTDGSAFVNVTYSKLFRIIRRHLGSYVVSAATKWIVVLNDFIRTIEELREGVALDKEFIDFYNRHEKSIGALLEAQKNLPKSMIAKLNEITRLILLAKQPSKEDFYSSKIDCYAEYDLTYKDIEQVGAPVDLIIYIDTKECDILIGITEGTNIQMNSLVKFLSDRKQKYPRWEGNNDYLLVKKLDIFESDEVIAKEFQHLLDIVLNDPYNLK